MVRPEHVITAIQKIHDIRNEDVAEAQPFAGVRDDVLAHLADAVLVAHNAHVDVGVLERELRDCQCPEVFDTGRAARRTG